jgi:hypothetical protein
MPRLKRCFTKTEAEVIKPYLKYFGFEDDTELECLNVFLEGGMVCRTPTIKILAKNYKASNPGGSLPECLKL